MGKLWIKLLAKGLKDSVAVDQFKLIQELTRVHFGAGKIINQDLMSLGTKFGPTNAGR